LAVTFWWESWLCHSKAGECPLNEKKNAHLFPPNDDHRLFVVFFAHGEQNNGSFLGPLEFFCIVLGKRIGEKKSALNWRQFHQPTSKKTPNWRQFCRKKFLGGLRNWRQFCRKKFFWGLRNWRQF
jgi:hypothetical protein